MCTYVCVCARVCMRVLSLAGAGAAGYSRLDEADSAQGRYHITEAMGELNCFPGRCSTDSAPSCRDSGREEHYRSRQAASPAQVSGEGAVGSWPRAEPTIPLLLQQVAVPIWTAIALLPFGLELLCYTVATCLFSSRARSWWGKTMGLGQPGVAQVMVLGRWRQEILAPDPHQLPAPHRGWLEEVS